jgi:porphobilinogen deaminase
VETEREVLRLAGATCALPLGTYARVAGGEIVIDAAIAGDAGIRRAQARGAAPHDVAREIADALGVMAHA